MPKVPLRSWATPLTIGTFLLMSVTGVLMFFEWDRGLTAVAHQWLSWIFLVGAAGHIAINFRAFKNRLKSRWGSTITVVSIAILVASLFSWGMLTGPQLERPVEEALVDAPLSALANVTQTDPDLLIGRFRAHGIDATGEQSIRELAGSQNVDENHLLGLVFLPE